MNDAVQHANSPLQVTKKSARRAAKPQLSLLQKLTPEDLQTLRLDQASRTEFDAVLHQFNRSRAALTVFEGEDAGSMDHARYDQYSAAESEQHSSGMAVVHFMAPRILRLREGAAKRKWRSFLTKFRKDEKLA